MKNIELMPSRQAIFENVKISQCASLRVQHNVHYVVSNQIAKVHKNVFTITERLFQPVRNLVYIGVKYRDYLK